MKFTIEISDEELQNVANDITKKKVKRVYAAELEKQLSTIKAAIKQSVQSAVEEFLPDLDKKIQKATIKFLKKYEHRIEDTIVGILKQKLENTRAINMLSFKMDLGLKKDG